MINVEDLRVDNSVRKIFTERPLLSINNAISARLSTHSAGQVRDPGGQKRYLWATRLQQRTEGSQLSPRQLLSDKPKAAVLRKTGKKLQPRLIPGALSLDSLSGHI